MTYTSFDSFACAMKPFTSGGSDLKMQSSGHEHVKRKSRWLTNSKSEKNEQKSENTSYCDGVGRETGNQKRECCPDWLRQVLCCLFVTVLICSSLTAGLIAHQWNLNKRQENYSIK